jgi:hypothetical protein
VSVLTFMLVEEERNLSNLRDAACQTETHWADAVESRATISEARALRSAHFSSGHVFNTHVATYQCFDIQVFTTCVIPLFRQVKL